jgi:hypothetical protein
MTQIPAYANQIDFVDGWRDQPACDCGNTTDKGGFVDCDRFGYPLSPNLDGFGIRDDFSKYVLCNECLNYSEAIDTGKKGWTPDDDMFGGPAREYEIFEAKWMGRVFDMDVEHVNEMIERLGVDEPLLERDYPYRTINGCLVTDDRGGKRR